MKIEICKYERYQHVYLASAKPKPGSFRDALEHMEEFAVREGKDPGNCVSRVPAYHHLADKFIQGFHQVDPIETLNTWLSAERKLTPVKLVSTSLTIGWLTFHCRTSRARRRRLAGLTTPKHKLNLDPKKMGLVYF